MKIFCLPQESNGIIFTVKYFQVYYVNVFMGVAWYTARDSLGRAYYYEENGNESCWTLPSVAQTIQDHSAAPSPAPARPGPSPDPDPELEDSEAASKRENLRHKFYPLVKEKTRIHEKLRRFFMRRPNVEELMKRGIIKNKPVFGTTLQLLARVDVHVPLFVRKCVSVIESRPEYLKTDGVYRQSGYLSVLQKIRLQIDQGNFSVM